MFPAAWFTPNYSIWIGEQEEAQAWDLLRRTRLDLRRAEQQGAPPDQLDAAFAAMYAAEGSDWLWWYGSDQDSGDDRYFDAAYRELLGFLVWRDLKVRYKQTVLGAAWAAGSRPRRSTNSSTAAKKASGSST